MSNPTTGEWTADRVYRAVQCCGHDGLAKEINAALAAEQEKLRESDAAVCSLLALAAVVKGKPETPQSLKDLASRELRDSNRGAYLIEELRQLHAALAAEQEKVENLHKILGQKRTTIKELKSEAEVSTNRISDKDLANQQLREQLVAEQEKQKVVLSALDILAVELTNHRHQWSSDQRGLYEHAVEILQGGQIHTQPMPK